MAQSLTFKQVTAEDMGDWLELTLSLWPDADREEERAEFAELLESSLATAFIVRTTAGEAVAFMNLSLRRDYVPGASASPVAFVEGIFVAEAFRGQGVASRLIACAEGWAKAKGCGELASDALLENRASHAFHEAAGFSEVERVVCFIKVLP